MMAAMLLLAASLFLLLAHIARAIRWSLLFTGDRARSVSLLFGLSLGYVLNAVIPFRLGEFLRTYVVSQQDGIRFSFVAATVVAERLSDLVVVGAIATLVWLLMAQPSDAVFLVAASMLATSAGAIAFGVATRRSQAARRAVWAFSSVFNDRIRFGMADLCWTFGALIADGSLLKRRYLVGTAIMWVFYGISYALFARVIAEDLLATVYALLGTPLRPLAIQVVEDGLTRDALLLLLFVSLPLIGAIAYGFVRRRAAIGRLLAAVRLYGGLDPEAALHRRIRFKRVGEYEYFLASLFADDQHIISAFGLRAMEDGQVHRLFHGGSDAITALVEVEEHLLIRKFAQGAPAEKLKVQADWITRHGGGNLPLVEIVGQREGPGFFRYDMPLLLGASDLYDVIHTSDLDASRRILDDVRTKVSDFHETAGLGPAATEAVDGYLVDKVSRNAVAILEFAEAMLPERSYEINGQRHDLADWNRLLDPHWLSTQIRHRDTAAIHGDLTIENVIVAPQLSRGWYIIDPNPENVFDTPLIDWAKQMQSVHLGYEGLNRGVPCTLTDSAIRLSFTKSHAYTTLHGDLERFLMEQYGPDVLREVYFHELVNYLRLTPYKIRQDPVKGLTFFACTSVLLQRYLDRIR